MIDRSEAHNTLDGSEDQEEGLDEIFGNEEDLDEEDGYEDEFDDAYNSIGDQEVGVHESEGNL